MSLKKQIGFILWLVIMIPVAYLSYRFYQKANTPPPVVIEPREEIDVTIIPGWTLRQVAASWVDDGLISEVDFLYENLGEPAHDYDRKNPPRLDWVKDNYPLLSAMPTGAIYEGYLMPDTYRVYQDAGLEEVLTKIFNNLENKITLEMREEIERQGKTFFEILTMASIVEKEAPDKENMAMVADIFWRRYDIGMALQSCATVNYVTGKYTPAISAEDKKIDSLYNTYMYPGLPPGPIANPSLTAIEATIYPTKNSYWYFMSGTDGQIHYAKDLEGHNLNVWRYLR